MFQTRNPLFFFFGFCKLIVSYDIQTIFIVVFTVFRARRSTLKSTHVIMHFRFELLACDQVNSKVLVQMDELSYVFSKTAFKEI